MNGWRQDAEWADKFMPEIKRVLGEHLISAAPAYEDQRRNTDLMVGDRELVLAAIRVGVRVRSAKYLTAYSHQFTIRTERYSGNETELAKIIRGYGDFFFYGIAADDEASLACWVLLDLAEFRLWFMQQIVTRAGVLPGYGKSNHDDSSAFRAFDIEDLPETAIRARQTVADVMYADLPF